MLLIAPISKEKKIWKKITLETINYWVFMKIMQSYFSFEDEKLYYYESEVIEDMIGCAVEKDLLKKVDMLPEKEQTEILKKYLKE